MREKKIPFLYLLFITLILTVWAVYMYLNSSFHVIQENVSVIITMFFGAFLAGSSPEGSASLAYPVFTLFLDIPPDVARNFAFAIQSVGMTAATIFIFNTKIVVDWLYIKYVTIGGFLGLIIGTFYIAPYVPAVYAKLGFVSLWLAFGLSLFLVKRNSEYAQVTKLNHLNPSDISILFILGIIGGFISSIFGTGINIFSFCFLVMYFNVNEKTATPSSIVIMTFETILGFALHGLYVADMSTKTYDMWLSCIPFVIFVAPLGTYVMNKVSSRLFNNFLYFIFFIQYVGAIIVIRPGPMMMMASFSIIILGVVFFKYIRTLSKLG